MTVHETIERGLSMFSGESPKKRGKTKESDFNLSRQRNLANMNYDGVSITLLQTWESDRTWSVLSSAVVCDHIIAICDSYDSGYERGIAGVFDFQHGSGCSQR